MQMDEPLNQTLIYTHGCLKQTMDTHIKKKITQRLAVLMDLLCNAMDQITTYLNYKNGRHPFHKNKKPHPLHGRPRMIHSRVKYYDPHQRTTGPKRRQ